MYTHLVCFCINVFVHACMRIYISMHVCARGSKETDDFPMQIYVDVYIYVDVNNDYMYI